MHEAYWSQVKSSLIALKTASSAEIELAQIDANLVFIDLCKAGKVLDFDVEAVMLYGFRADLSGAYERWVRSLPSWSIRGGVRSPPSCTPNPLCVPAPAFDVESVEKIAKEVGVVDTHGPNATELISSEGASSNGEQVSGKTASVDGEPVPEMIVASASSGWLYPL